MRGQLIGRLRVIGKVELTADGTQINTDRKRTAHHVRPTKKQATAVRPSETAAPRAIRDRVEKQD